MLLALLLSLFRFPVCSEPREPREPERIEADCFLPPFFFVVRSGESCYELRLRIPSPGKAKRRMIFYWLSAGSYCQSRLAWTVLPVLLDYFCSSSDSFAFVGDMIDIIEVTKLPNSDEAVAGSVVDSFLIT